MFISSWLHLFLPSIAFKFIAIFYLIGKEYVCKNLCPIYLGIQGAYLKAQSNCQSMGCLGVATLVLGSRPRPRGCKGVGQERARESHHILPGV
jgi:hypothetical protein